MTLPARFDEAGQRRALERLAESIEFLHQADGREFIEQIRGQLAPRALREIRRLGLGGEWICLDEAVSTALVELMSDGGRVARYASVSDGEPWDYLLVCLVGWLRRQVGTRCSDIDGLTLEAAGPRSGENDLTPMQTVVDRMHDELAPFTPLELREELRELLIWFACNPPQRQSYELEERGAAAGAAPGFARSQISAVMNIAWGGRPRRPQTSLMAALLLDAEFRVSDSPTHARALLHYARTMRRNCAPLPV